MRSSIGLRDGEVDEGPAVCIDGGRGGGADLESRTQRVDVIGVGDFCCGGVQKQIAVVTANNATCRVPDVPVAGAVGALDQHEPGAGCEATVNAKCGASAGVAADFADASERCK